MKQALVLCFGVFMFVSNGFAITLDEAVQLSLKKNAGLQAQRLEETAAQGRLEQARLLLPSNPIIEGTLSKTKYPADAGGQQFNNYEVRLSQELEIAGQRGLRVDTAEKGLEKATMESKDRERLLIAEVKDAFAEALASIKKKELAGETVKLQEELSKYAEIKFQAGEVAALEMNLAAVELGKAKRDLLQSSRETRNALLVLQGLLGLKPDPGFSIEGGLPADSIPIPDKENLRALAASRRPDIRAISAEVRAADSAMKLAGRRAVPNVTVSGFYEKDERADIAGLMLSVPLPFFDRNKGERRETRARSDQAKIRQTDLENSIDRELDEAHSGLMTAIEELSLFRKEILDKALENLDLMNLSYKEGKIGFFEVRLAQKDTLDAQFAYLESQLKLQLAVNALEKTTGGSLK